MRRWDATVMVECNICGRTIEVDIVEFTHGLVGPDDDALEDAGWTSEQDHDTCPDCQEEA